MKDNNEAVFKELALRYVEADGKLLNEEVKGCRGTDVFTPELDKLVHKKIYSKKNARNMWIISAVAVAAVMIVMFPNVLRLSQRKNGTMDMEQSSQLIPISFTMPDNLSVASKKLDNGQSVYRLDNTTGDSIVMTMERDVGLPDTSQLSDVNINGYTVYAAQTADYNFIAFTKDGVTYTMTCRYQIETLVELSENIL